MEFGRGAPCFPRCVLSILGRFAQPRFPQAVHAIGHDAGRCVLRVAGGEGLKEDGMLRAATQPHNQ
eukprot:6089037-Lingulodinium_polyedra.AAC.1